MAKSIIEELQEARDKLSNAQAKFDESVGKVAAIVGVVMLREYGSRLIPTLDKLATNAEKTKLERLGVEDILKHFDSELQKRQAKAERAKQGVAQDPASPVMPAEPTSGSADAANQS